MHVGTRPIDLHTARIDYIANPDPAAVHIAQFALFVCAKVMGALYRRYHVLAPNVGQNKH